MTEHEYELYTRQATPPFARTGVLRNYTRFGYTDRYQAIGEFALTVTGDEAPEVSRALTGNLLEIVRDGQQAFVGFIRGRKFNYDQQAPNSSTVEFKGWDLGGWVLRRRCAIPPDGVQYYGNSGPAESVLKQAILDHFTDPTDAKRLLPYLTIEPDLARGINVVVNLRGEKFDDTASKIALAGNIGFRVVLGSDSLLQFQVYQGATTPIVFTPDYQDLLGFVYEEDLTDLENHVYTLGGDGSAITRFFVEDEDATSVSRWGRWEAVQDGRNAYNSDIAHTQGAFYLAPKTSVNRVSFIPRDSAAAQYLTNWQLGDTVRVRYDRWGADVTAPIVEVKVSVEAGRGEQIETTVNLLPADFIRKLRAQIQAVQPALFAPNNLVLADGRIEIASLTSDPVPAAGFPPVRQGQIYYNSSTGTINYFNGSVWKVISTV